MENKLKTTKGKFVKGDNFLVKQKIRLLANIKSMVR